MSADLAALQGRVRAALMDTGSRVWEDAALEEALRLALGEYMLAGKITVSLAGLDGAAETTLPAAHESLLVWGGSAYAALARAVDRAERTQLAGVPAALADWGGLRLKEFKAMLAAVFPGYLTVLTSAAAADPAKAAAEIALLQAQAALTQAQSDLALGQERRAQSAADLAAAERAAEATRLSGLRIPAEIPWRYWVDDPDW